jgi:post-segregation antitoxin (ccd killing protein)
LTLVQKMEGVSFRKAFEILQAGYPSAAVPSSSRPVKKSTVLKLPALAEVDESDRELMLHVVRFYRENLKQKPAALEYLRRRGIGSEEAIERFSIGFSDRTLGYRLPASNRAAGASLRSRLQALGVYAPSGHERLRGCIAVPLFDEHGAVVQIYGRRISDKIPKKERHLLLPVPRAGVFNREAFAASSEIIVCEGIFNALSFFCAGHRNVTACLGAGSLTEEIVQCFVRNGTERAFLAFDPDEGGERGTGEAAERLMGAGVECFAVEFPAGLDANEFALQHPPAERSLGQLLSLARRIGGGRQRAAALELAPGESAGKVPELVLEGPAGKGLELAESEVSDPSGREERERTPAEGPAENEQPAAQQPAAPATREEVYTPRPGPAHGLSSLAAQAAEPPAAPSDPPAAPSAALKLEGEQAELLLGERRYRVRGLGKNTSLEQLKVNLRCERGEDWHQDNVDLYSARSRQGFVKQAATELGIDPELVKRDLGKLLRALEELHHNRLAEALRPKAAEVRLSEREREEALELLRDPRLLERIVEDFERCGLVGERTNKLVGYLAATSRLLQRPLGVLIQSGSAAGKSWLMDAVLAFMPPEAVHKYSAMTGQSLYYLGEKDLRHKVLAIAEQQGAERASYALKLLLSEGRLSIASAGKDPDTGRHVTQEYSQEGPVAVFNSTTGVEVDEELMNRCIVQGVDESREQTRAIHDSQRRRHGPEGLWAEEEREAVTRLHQNAQRLLEPLKVVNPYERHLTFLDDRTRTRRDHLKYLTLIEAIALLHQHQRPRLSQSRYGKDKLYIEATLADVELATVLSHQIFGRSLDELPPQTRRFVSLLGQMAAQQCAARGIQRSEYRFSQREAREHTGWSAGQVKLHLKKLAELEYVLSHRGGRGQSFVYELLYNGEGADGRPFLLGLLDTRALREQLGAHPYDAKWDRFLGQWDQKNDRWDRSGNAAGVPRAQGGQGGVEADGKGAEGQTSRKSVKNAVLVTEVKTPTAPLVVIPRNGSTGA